MIAFDLRCDGGHVFEAWFGSSEAFADQKVRGLITCPICTTPKIEKAVMAPNVGTKSNRTAPRKAEPPPAAVKAAMAALAQAQAQALEASTWVGGGFSSQARAMHAGDAPHAPIYSKASIAEASALVDDGVPIAPLPFPVVPPNTRN